MLVYSSVLGSIPDEIALKALPAAFAVCRYQHQFIVDWNNAIKELQAAALPSASETWMQTRRIAKRIQDNSYHARYGGIVTHEGKITPYQLREENRRLFGELPPAIQAWAVHLMIWQTSLIGHSRIYCNSSNRVLTVL